MKLRNIFSAVLFASSGIIVVGCGGGSSSSNTNPNQPVLSLMSYQNLGESIITCQHERINDPELVGGWDSLLNVTGVNSNGVLAVNSTDYNNSLGVCATTMAHTGIISSKLSLLNIESTWNYNENGEILPVNDPSSSTLEGISDNSITVGQIQVISTKTGNFAALGNTSIFSQMGDYSSYFNRESQNDELTYISKNGTYAIGVYTEFLDPDNHFNGGSYNYGYLYNISNNTYVFPSINSYLLGVNNRGNSVGYSIENNGIFGVYCDALGVCNSVKPNLDINNSIESQFAFIAINNNGIMLGQENVFYYDPAVDNIVSLSQIKFYSTSGSVLKTLDTNHEVVYNTLTDDNTVIVSQLDNGSPYFYTIDTNKYFALGSVIQQITGWDMNDMFNAATMVQGISQDGHYLYGATNINSREGTARVPFTIYFNKGISYYLNNIYKDSSSSVTATSANNLKSYSIVTSKIKPKLLNSQNKTK